MSFLSHETVTPLRQEAEWYYRSGDRIHGPLTFEDLRASLALGFLSPNDAICIRRRSAWIPAGDFLRLGQRGAGPSPRPPSVAPRLDAGFTLLEVLVVMAACALLAAAALPAVAAAREASRRSGCADHQRRVAAAILASHESHGRFPTGLGFERESGDCAPKTGRFVWTFAVLPHLGYSRVADLIPPGSYAGGTATPGIDPNLREALQTVITPFLCPSDTHMPITERTPPGRFWDAYTQSNVVACFSPHGFHVEPEANRPCLIAHIMDGGQATVANPTVVSEDPWMTLPGRSVFNFFGRPRSLGDVTDGRSSTAMLSEVIAGGGLPPVDFIDTRGTWWTDQGAAYSHWHTPNDPRPDHQGFGGRQRSPKRGVPDVVFAPGGWPAVMTAARSRHPGGVNVAFVDGAVRFVDEGIDPAVWTAMGSMDGGEAESRD